MNGFVGDGMTCFEYVCIAADITNITHPDISRVFFGGLESALMNVA